MSEQTQQPHLEILSRNKINRSTIIIAAIPVSVFSGLVAYALWNFLWLIAYGAMVLLAAGGLYLLARWTISLRRQWLHAPYIPVPPQHSVFDASKQRMVPLSLAAPIVEEKLEPLDRVKQAMDILEVHSHGVGIQSIADSYKGSGDTYWTPWRVRQLIQSQNKP